MFNNLCILEESIDKIRSFLRIPTLAPKALKFFPKFPVSFLSSSTIVTITSNEQKNQKTKPGSEMSVFNSLPNEIMLLILLYLSTQDLKVLDLVMKSCLSLKKNWFVLIKELFSPNYSCSRVINMNESPSSPQFMIQLKDGRLLTTSGCAVTIWNILTGNCAFFHTFPKMINTLTPPVELEDNTIFFSLENGKCVALNLETKETDYRIHFPKLAEIHFLDGNCGILIDKHGFFCNIYDLSDGRILGRIGFVGHIETFSKNLVLTRTMPRSLRTWKQTQGKHPRYIKSYHLLASSVPSSHLSDLGYDLLNEELCMYATNFIEVSDGRIVFSADLYDAMRILTLNPGHQEGTQERDEGKEDDSVEIGYSPVTIKIEDTFSILLELPVKHCQQLLELSVSLSPMVATTAVQSRMLLAIACNQFIYLYDFDQNQVIRVFQHSDGGGVYDTNQHEVKMVNLPHIQRLASYIPSPYLQSYSRIMIWNVIQGGCERILLHPGSSTIDILLVVKMPWNDDKDSKDGKKEGSEEIDCYGFITSSFRNQMIFVWKPDI